MLTVGKQVYKRMYFLTLALVWCLQALQADSVWAVGLLRKCLVSGFQAEEKESHAVLPYPSRGKKHS